MPHTHYYHLSFITRSQFHNFFFLSSSSTSKYQPEAGVYIFNVSLQIIIGELTLTYSTCARTLYMRYNMRLQCTIHMYIHTYVCTVCPVCTIICTCNVHIMYCKYRTVSYTYVCTYFYMYMSLGTLYTVSTLDCMCSTSALNILNTLEYIICISGNFHKVYLACVFV